MRKTISILGCGWYGLELAKHLVSKNFSVKGSTTSIEKLDLIEKEGIHPYLVNFQQERMDYDPNFFKSTILVICIPPKRNANEQSDFPNKIDRICKAAKDNGVDNVLFISSTSVYGDLNTELSESDRPHPITASGKAMFEAEKILLNQNKFKTTILRFGGLIGPGRDPGKFFAGKLNTANGKAPINLIHITDCIGISTQIIEKEAFGYTFNACSPDHPSKQNFYTQATINSGLTPPTFINELNNWKIVICDQVQSVLQYNYQVPSWEQWLKKAKL